MVRYEKTIVNSINTILVAAFILCLMASGRAFAAPSASITSPSDGAVLAQGTISVTGSALGGANGLQIWILSYAKGGNPPDGDFVNFIGNSNVEVNNGKLGDWNADALADGQYTLWLKVTDLQGGQAEAKVVVTLGLPADDNAPTTTISPSGTTGDNSWYLSSVEVTLLAEDDSSGVDFTKYRIDSGSWQDYSSSFTISDEGEHTVEYYSVDKKENQEDIHTKTIKIDTAPPTGSITIASGNQYTHSSSVTLSLSASDNTSGMTSGQMEFSADGSSWTSPETYSTTKQYHLASGDGTKRVYVKFKDSAGNWSTAEISDTIILDETTPTTSVSLSGTSGDNGWHLSKVTVTLSTTDTTSTVCVPSAVMSKGEL